MDRLRKVLPVYAAIFLFSSVGARATEIIVLSDGPLAPALKPIGESFRRASGNAVKFVFGLSPAIHKVVTEGQPADIVIIQPNFIDELIKDGKVTSGAHSEITRVGIAVFTRADAGAPEISTADSLKQALLGADSIAFSNVAAGNYFATVLQSLGIADALQSKITRASPADVVTHVLEGKGKDLGVGTKTLILADKRLKLVGNLPDRLQSYLVYAAAITTNSKSPDTAANFIRFLRSPEAKKEFAASGAE